MYYGKQIHANQKVTYISSSALLPYSKSLIEISEQEFNIAMQQEEIRKQKEEEQKRLKEYDIVEPNQEIVINEKDLI